MKTLFTLLFLTACIQGMGQTSPKEYYAKANSIFNYHIDQLVCSINSDTLELVVPGQIHFIKIGTEVYQIVPHPVTIEEVKKVTKLTLGGMYWNGLPTLMLNDEQINTQPDKLKKP